MFQWTKWSLNTKNLLVCQDQNLYGVRGVQQGSPLGPLFFSLALQEVLSKLRPLFENRPECWKIWYIDDGTIYGTLELLELVLTRLEEELPGIGLALNLTKCVLITASTEICFPHLAEVAHVDISDEKQGFKVLGIPMGGKEYVKKAFEETAYKVAQFCEGVVSWSILKWASSCCGYAAGRVVWCTSFEPLVAMAWTS